MNSEGLTLLKNCMDKFSLSIANSYFLAYLIENAIFDGSDFCVNLSNPEIIDDTGLAERSINRYMRILINKHLIYTVNVDGRTSKRRKRKIVLQEKVLMEFGREIETQLWHKIVKTK